MTRPPFFAFYPADFAGDITVEAMTTLQVGAYILLLCKAWQADPPASLPNDDAVLARLARLTPAEWSEVKAGVLSPFSLGTDNRWHQKRLRQEYEKAKALIKDRAKAGRSGAQARWQTHGKRMAEPVRPQCESNGIQSQSQSQSQKKKERPSDACSELAIPPASEPPVLTYPCDGPVAEWHLTAAKVAEYQATYPALDVPGECRKALQWVRDNPAKRKTAGGMPKYLNGWLARAQNDGRGRGGPGPKQFKNAAERVMDDVYDALQHGGQPT